MQSLENNINVSVRGLVVCYNV